MNILVVRDTNPFAISSATNNRFLSLCEGIIENGNNIDILLLNGYYKTSEKIAFKRAGCINSINYIYVFPVNYSNFISRQFFYRIVPNLLLYLKIMKYLKKKKYDYVWLDFGPKVVQISMFLFKHKYHFKYFHERSEYSWIGFENKKTLHEKYLKIFLPQINVFSVMTKNLEAYYNDFFGPETKVIHLPMTVDFNRFEIITKNELKENYIAYCGTMNNAKDGVDILIHSFLNIMHDYPSLHLYLAGPLTPKKDFNMQKAIIDHAKANDRITYLGNLPKEEIPSFLSNASVLALARPESKQTHGGFPTKLGEYLATGKPVCVTNVGEICNYLTDNESAYIAVPGSIASFTNCLKNALTSCNAKSVGEKGKKVALDNFNKEIQSKTLSEYLEKQL